MPPLTFAYVGILLCKSCPKCQFYSLIGRGVGVVDSRDSIVSQAMWMALPGMTQHSSARRLDDQSQDHKYILDTFYLRTIGFPVIKMSLRRK